MSHDADEICEDSNLSRPIADMFKGIQYKLFALMFFTFIVLSSDVFVTRVLCRFPGATDQKNITSWGTILQGLFLVLACLIFDIIIRLGVI